MISGARGGDGKNSNDVADRGTDISDIGRDGEGGDYAIDNDDGGHDRGLLKACYDLVYRPVHDSGAVSVALDIIDSCAFGTEDGVDDAAIVDIPKGDSDGCMMNAASRGERIGVDAPLVLQNTDRKDTRERQ